MLWAALAILTAIIYAVVVVVDKVVMEKWIKHPMIPMLFVGLASLLFSVAIFFIRGFSKLSYFNIFLALLSGAFTVGMGYFYFKAIQIEEASRIGPLFSLGPLFVAVFAAIFLGEIFTLVRYLGLVSIVAGAIMISTRNIKLKLSKAFWFMMLVSCFGTASVLLSKYLLGFADYWSVFAYVRIGNFLAIIPALFIYAPKLASAVRKHGKKILVPLFANQCGNALAMLTFIMAMSIGFVTLVTALSATQPFFILVFSIFLSIFFPKILKEKITKQIIIQKALAITLMFAGALLIV